VQLKPIIESWPHNKLTVEPEQLKLTFIQPGTKYISSNSYSQWHSARRFLLHHYVDYNTSSEFSLVGWFGFFLLLPLGA
jgi:hypothetical protein